jgi:hypothetical protein
MAASTVIAFLDNGEHTEKVIHALQAAGFRDQDLSIAMHDWSEQREPGESQTKLIEWSNASDAPVATGEPEPSPSAHSVPATR